MVQVSLPIKAISLILGDRIIAVGDTETDADMVIISGKPPLCRGDSQSLTFAGVNIKPLIQ